MSGLRDAALILLALEGGFAALLAVGTMAAVNYALFRSRWWEVLPRFFARARGYLHRGQRGIEQASRAATQPFLTLASITAALRQVAQEALRSKE